MALEVRPEEPSSALRAEAERVAALFAARGAEPFETSVLQPAGPLLDLYGEDIRARAFVTADPLRGETMLRPDFTVPLVRDHVAGGRGAARYAYAGEVFRRQEVPGRAREYVQVGFELFGGGVEADAEAFGAVAEAVGGAAAPVIGDIGLLLAAVRGLETSPRRRAALLRHVWRPARFRALLARYAERPPMPGPAGAAEEIGARSRAEVEARRAAMEADAAVPPLAPGQVAPLEALIALRGRAGDALEAAGRLDAPGLAPAVERLAARLDAMGARDLPFEATLGRASMEYYDGFTFVFAAKGGPPVATGGRYDALVRAMGGDVPAVGGVVRPAALVGAGTC
ncbi:ATP phosphoribosyltransferase regulatory subunit [Hasllibacter halocynthiae]|uniref:ATP phosphoribosyltransferase regulatory subunit n=1 Tax=Hasllibacter halocynthiae TaxID=595589 RepID=A0A2T0X103_9RHOB|nr:ATP phosphoribosyltransferase regulatory subunit [Hasllibacter halocynthiae]PRY92632.1 ATP phosphoribosyltransferase regulatory subunit [Hasllibacter halocynthiae]